MPKFSIIIPVYKVEKYIKQCTESVLNQTFSDFEAIFVDDCGGDNSIKIVEEYAQKDNRIKIVHHERNKGLAAARNTALRNACGEYIVCLDSDDWMAENCLEVINDSFEKANTTSVWFNTKKYYDSSNTLDSNPMYEQSEGYRTLLPETIAAYADFTWIKAYTRSSIQKYNLYWPEGLTFEDGEFYFKYFTLNPKTYIIEDCLIFYRHREDSIVRNADRGNVKMEDIYETLYHLKEFWIEKGVYQRYKQTMLKLLQNRIRMCYGLNYSDEYKKLSYKLLNDMNYPDDFIDLSQGDNNFPLVSIVIPFYNTEKHIEQCLNSVINQFYKNLEIICVDDCSDDKSTEIVEKYAQTDNRIKIIKHQNNMGVGAARNTGLNNAKGEYIFFIDSNDWIEPYCINQTVDKLMENNLNSVIYKADSYSDSTNTRTPIIFGNYNNWQEGDLIVDETNICNLPHYSWNKGYKRKFLIENDIKWTGNTIYSDIEFFFKLFIAAPNTYIINQPLYIHRVRNNSLNDNYENFVQDKDMFSAMIRIKNFLTENNLLDKHQNNFLQLLYKIINNYHNLPKIEKELNQLLLKCLNELSYPDDFKKGISTFR